MNYTKGPWRWFANRKSGQVHLATEGRGRVFVMSFFRKGLNGAQPAFQQHKEGCLGECRGCGELVPVFNAGYREDHNGEIEIADHPDARLIAAAPMLYEALKSLVDTREDFQQKALDAHPGNDYWSERFMEKYAKAEALLADLRKGRLDV